LLHGRNLGREGLKLAVPVVGIGHARSSGENGRKEAEIRLFPPV
jgi:hypothetical protein